MQQKKCMQAKFDYAFFCLPAWGYSCGWWRLCDIKDLFFLLFIGVFCSCGDCGELYICKSSHF